MKTETSPDNLVRSTTSGQSAGISLNWKDNASIQGLLDVVGGIMAEEYVRVARENAEVFRDLSASRPSGTSPQDDEDSGFSSKIK